ncbi:NADH:ubiquinone oxidoreductase kD subunit [Penicillium brasilianum]|uniref:NADH:ubiquinone oxidoreductase kD subunit n=1 Tax=Penicillium brasilianum TaxID=104259 RepID=A0A1S9RPX2_PENBI|nr:NADH:ubiquinone oxidoreductase kD subunit [Penicillium brasilianum]
MPVSASGQWYRKPPSVPSSTCNPPPKSPTFLPFPFQRSFGGAMLSQRILARRLPQVAARSAIAPRASFSQIPALRAAEVEDPLQNGGYQNPPRVKRQFRDPYGGWWDKQDKRNFGEPVHEENEILGVFSPEQYTHVSSGKGFLHLGAFVVTFLGLCGVVSLYYPDKPSVPKAYVDGLEKELGGPNALPARKAGEDKW